MRVVMPKPGKYIVAVSGGVDSLTLLRLLVEHSKFQGDYKFHLIVAHFDHGIRGDSSLDRRLVQRLAREYGLQFVYEEGHLGPAANEATARQARYRFLRRLLTEHGAEAIITAHHQDDLIETALLNLLRGTGRRGLTSLASTGDIIRPLLSISKKQLIEYAHRHNVIWREDSSNTDERYKRNYIRRQLMTNLSSAERDRLVALITEQRTVNEEVEHLLTDLLQEYGSQRQLNRSWFVTLPHTVAKEVLAAWLRATGIADFDRRGLERLTVGAKIGYPGKTLDIRHGWQLRLSKGNLALKGPER